jgi:hypothetical protein
LYNYDTAIFSRRGLSNVIIVGRYERTVNESYITLKKAQQMGLNINHAKTKYVEVSNNKTKEKHIIIDNKNIEN